jgi:hypothetical protein
VVEGYIFLQPGGVGWTIVELEKLKDPDGVAVVARVIHGRRKKQKERRC